MNLLQEKLKSMEIDYGTSKSISEGPRSKSVFESLVDLKNIFYKNKLDFPKTDDEIERVPGKSSFYVEQMLSDELHSLRYRDLDRKIEVFYSALDVAKKFNLNDDTFLNPLLKNTYLSLHEDSIDLVKNKKFVEAELNHWTNQIFARKIGFDSKIYDKKAAVNILDTLCDMSINNKHTCLDILKRDYEFAVGSAVRLDLSDTPGLKKLRHLINQKEYL